MKEQQSLSHTVWDCKYHIVWIPRYRKKSLYKGLRQYVGPVLKDLARQKECKIEEGHLMANHVHILISIPPKYSVAQVVGFIKGKRSSGYFVLSNICGDLNISSVSIKKKCKRILARKTTLTERKMQHN